MDDGLLGGVGGYVVGHDAQDIRVLVVQPDNGGVVFHVGELTGLVGAAHAVGQALGDLVGALLVFQIVQDAQGGLLADILALQDSLQHHAAILSGGVVFPVGLLEHLSAEVGVEIAVFFDEVVDGIIAQIIDQPVAGLVAFIAGILAAWYGVSLIGVASICCISVLIIEYIMIIL